MIALQHPATVLGPVIGWMKWALFLPMLVAMLAVLRGGGVSGWGVWAMLAVCSAVAAASAARVPWRRGAHLGLNFWFALTLFLMEVFWDGIVGVWSGVLGGFFGVCALFGADWVARWGLARLPLGAPDAKRIRLWLYSGSWAGSAMADEPVLLGLANGKRVMLWPGYRYVWRLAAKGYEPDEIGVVAGCGYGDHESGDS